MTTVEINNFIDCLTYENCDVGWNQKTYMCLGVTTDAESRDCRIEVWEYEPLTHEFTHNLLSFTGTSKEACMKHFLEDKYWDGKSFYEVAPDMEWIDL